MGVIANKLLALNSAKHAILNAINELGGRLREWSPLSAYPSEIRRIANVSYESFQTDRHRVVFIDWDGTVLKDVMVLHGDPVTPPEIPSKWTRNSAIGLSFKEWTHPDTDMASVTHDMCIGPIYTMLGNTKVVFRVPKQSNNYNFTAKGTSSSPVFYYKGSDGSGISITSTTNVSISVPDNADELVVFVTGNASSPAESTTGNYGRAAVFSSYNWADTNNNGYYVLGFGYPYGSPKTLSVGNGRYLHVGGIVLHSNTTTRPSFSLNQGQTFIACQKGVSPSIPFVSYGTSTVHIPILDFRPYGPPTSGKWIIERGLWSQLSTVNTISGGSLVCCFDDDGGANNINFRGNTCLSINVYAGSLNWTGQYDKNISLCLDSVGCRKLLETLPQRESGSGITISLYVFELSGYSVPADLTNLISQLQNKGYTVTMQSRFS